MPEVELSKPDKKLLGEVTKQQLAEYYAAVAERMVPLIAGRPANLERWPDGLDGHKIFTQHAPKHTPDWIRQTVTPKHGGDVSHVVVDDADTLRWLAQQATTSIHVWLSRDDRLTRPDRLIVDLDPGEDTTLDTIRSTARMARELLADLGLTAFVMTTGSRGFHVTVPIQRRYEYDEVKPVVRALAQRLVDEDPERLTTETRIAKREGRLYLDMGRVAYGHTAVAPWSPRAKPAGPVATPIEWDELDTTTPTSFTVADVPARPNPWADIEEAAAALGDAKRKLGVQ